MTLGTALATLLLGATLPGAGGDSRNDVELLNVSYDATRELYRDINSAFSAHWLRTTGQRVRVLQSHAGSARQAQAVIHGLPADVVSLALAYDIDEISVRSAGVLVQPGWRAHLPHNSAPFTSQVVFLVRAGNPRRIRDWDDLARPGVVVITPNPKTSGGGRWSYLALWGYARRAYASESDAQAFVARVFRNVPVLDAGARAAMTTFAERGVGDVIIAWETEARLALRRFGHERFDMVIPSVTIRTEPSIAVVDAVARRRGTLAIARAYVAFLYSPEAEAIAARHYFHTREHERTAAALTVDSLGGWRRAHREHFASGGTFDRLR